MDTTTQNQKAKAYNDEAEAMLFKSITWGNMQRPRVSLSDLIGVPSNDNSKKQGE
jgi:hypothetical protein